METPKPVVSREAFEEIDKEITLARAALEQNTHDKNRQDDLIGLEEDRARLWEAAYEEARKDDAFHDGAEEIPYNKSEDYRATLSTIEKIKTGPWQDPAQTLADPYARIQHAMPLTGKGAHGRLRAKLANIEGELSDLDLDIRAEKSLASRTALKEIRGFWERAYEEIAGPTKKFLHEMVLPFVTNEREKAEDEAEEALKRISEQSKSDLKRKKASH